MIDEQKQKEYYKALLEKDKSYEGTFYVGVKTTGVFCHSTCPARKPKFENCEFFKDANEALLMGYRACLKCNPLSNPNDLPENVKILLEELENNDYNNLTYEDYQRIGISSSYARRQFMKYFKMTFVQYARAIRLSKGLKEIKKGSKVIDAQLESSYESDSGFRYGLKSTFGQDIVSTKEISELYSCIISTKLGNMIAVSNDDELLLLEFVDRVGLENEMNKLTKKLNAVIIPKTTDVLKQTEQEISEYFNSQRKDFTVKIKTYGSEFVTKVWNGLNEIPIGTTISYLDLANEIGESGKFRAVGRANGLNQIAIIIPCHRVINTNGELGGYGGGLERKKWLLEHEKEMNDNLECINF